MTEQYQGQPVDIFTRFKFHTGEGRDGYLLLKFTNSGAIEEGYISTKETRHLVDLRDCVPKEQFQ